MSYISAVQQWDEVIVWERNPEGRKEVRYPAPYNFYVKDERGDHLSIFNEKVFKLEFDTFKDFQKHRDEFKASGFKLYESDIACDFKILSKYYYNKPAPNLHLSFYDIEVDYRTEKYSDDFIVKINHKKSQTVSDAFEISVKDLRTLDVIDYFYVWDQKSEKWVDAKTSRYMYTGEIGSLWGSKVDRESGKPRFIKTLNTYAPINAITFYHNWKQEYVVIAIPPDDNFNLDDLGYCMFDNTKKIKDLARIVLCRNERELLRQVILEIEDTDALVGWNNEEFDLPYIGKRILKVLGEGVFKRLSFKNAKNPRFRTMPTKFGNEVEVLDISGRVNLDYMKIFKKFEPGERYSFSLDAITEEIVPEMRKMHHDLSLEELYRQKFSEFLRYNLRDVEALVAIEEKKRYIETANMLVHLSSGQFKSVTGSLRLLENSVINHCHYELNKIVPDCKERGGEFLDEADEHEKAEGAYVLEPKKGLHQWIGSVDVNSLYPSAIISINISPETLIGQFINDVSDFEDIMNKNNKELTIVLEESGETLTKTVKDWRRWLKEKKYSVSGYGTVFDQNFQGVIPMLLTLWFSKRKEHKKKMNECKKNSDVKGYEYHDTMQYIFKIRLNSIFGLQLNRFFRFYDNRLGESTTGTGRYVLKHQCATINKMLCGDFEAEGKRILAGDSDSLARFLHVNLNEVNDTIETHYNNLSKQYKIDKVNENTELLNINGTLACNTFENEKYISSPIKHLYRHKTDKKMYKIKTKTKEIVVTEDHSCMIVRNNKIMAVTPLEILKTDKVICL